MTVLLSNLRYLSRGQSPLPFIALMAASGSNLLKYSATTDVTEFFIFNPSRENLLCVTTFGLYVTRESRGCEFNCSRIIGHPSSGSTKDRISKLLGFFGSSRLDMLRRVSHRVLRSVCLNIILSNELVGAASNRVLN